MVGYGSRLRPPPTVVDSIVVDGVTYGTIYATIYGTINLTRSNTGSGTRSGNGFSNLPFEFSNLPFEIYLLGVPEMLVIIWPLVQTG